MRRQGGTLSGAGECWSYCAFLLLAGCLPFPLAGQEAAGQAAVLSGLPDAPSSTLAYALPGQTSAVVSGTGISGTVLDTDGAEIPGAILSAEELNTRRSVTVKSGEDGSFNIPDLVPGTYLVTVKAEGFSLWTAKEVVVRAGETTQMPPIPLEIAPLNSSVDAVFTPHDMAEDQIRVEEKQRVLGIVPNFYVVYDWHAAPLSAGQKFRLALRVEVDPFTLLGSGLIAGVEQATNSFPGYGEGAAGFGKRYAASYADGFAGTLIGGAMFPSLFHQDPRYFYKGTGSIRSRALYAISTVVICKGDNGKWQPNYSSVLGNLAAAGISNAYYPASNRNGAGVTVDNALIGTAAGAVSSLLQEFFLRHVTPGSSHSSTAP